MISKEYLEIMRKQSERFILSPEIAADGFRKYTKELLVEVHILQDQLTSAQEKLKVAEEALEEISKETGLNKTTHEALEWAQLVPPKPIIIVTCLNCGQFLFLGVCKNKDCYAART